MKFRDVIQKVIVHDIVSRTLQMEKQPYCYDVDHQSSQYQIHIFCKDQYKYIYDIKQASRADFFVSTILKLAYNCEHEFQSFEEVLKLIDRIMGCLWDRYSYDQMIKSAYNVIKTFIEPDLVLGEISQQNT
ncbi:MAG: hypothetical protein HXO06_00540 [Prevotella salivae]|uniref:hypothetical protein n=1 Tax=Segatella salivae TaxID=228604 RepID=UPI001CB5E348|nr:hypothetical protein [Segatella salivae]MBF1543664.1 hypothetical protein [Segatella salivae]